jgi:hypothetical protein
LPSQNRINAVRLALPKAQGNPFDSIRPEHALATGPGITIEAAATVHLEDLTIQHCQGTGIFDERSTGGFLFIKNTVIRFNAGAGVVVAATGGNNQAILENVQSVTNATGIEVGSGNTATVSRSVMSNNGGAGVQADTGGTILVDNTEITGNGTGVAANGVIVMANSDIYFNATGVSGSGLTASYGNNRILGNTSEGTTPAVGAASTDHGQE